MEEITFPEAHFTVESVAAARGITVQAVRKALNEGRLRGVKIAATWFIPKSELEDRGWITKS